MSKPSAIDVLDLRPCPPRTAPWPTPVRFACQVRGCPCAELLLVDVAGRLATDLRERIRLALKAASCAGWLLVPGIGWVCRLCAAEMVDRSTAEYEVAEARRAIEKRIEVVAVDQDGNEVAVDQGGTKVAARPRWWRGGRR